MFTTNDIVGCTAGGRLLAGLARLSPWSQTHESTTVLERRRVELDRGEIQDEAAGFGCAPGLEEEGSINTQSIDSKSKDEAQ